MAGESVPPRAPLLVLFFRRSTLQINVKEPVSRLAFLSRSSPTLPQWRPARFHLPLKGAGPPPHPSGSSCVRANMHSGTARDPVCSRQVRWLITNTARPVPAEALACARIREVMRTWLQTLCGRLVTRVFPTGALAHNQHVGHLRQ